MPMVCCHKFYMDRASPSDDHGQMSSHWPPLITIDRESLS